VLRIQEYRISDLRQCLCPSHWFRSEPAPITKHRALSHVNNPRAEAGDVALLVAYDGDAVVAHLGILPDLVFSNQSSRKIGWLTAWWANPDRKYAGIGLTLLSRAFALYQGNLGASGFSESARRVYDATKKFVTIGNLGGISGFARLNLCRLLRRRLPQLAKFRSLLGVVDALANQYVSLRQWWWRQRHAFPQGVRLEYLPEMDPEADEFIQRHSFLALAKRGAKELNWIAKYPWVLAAPLSPPSSFHFSSPIESYSVFNIKVYNGDERLVAVLMVILMDGHVIVPYCLHDGQSGLIAQILAHLLLTQRAERLTLFHKDLVERFYALRFPWLLLLKKRRAWILSSECVEDGVSAWAMQDGDGDCAFTA
jgi:hypothetical protein